MDWLTFWARVIDAAAGIIRAALWPGTVLAIVWVFRARLAEVVPSLAERLKHWKYPGGEVAFSEELVKIGTALVAQDPQDKQQQRMSPSGRWEFGAHRLSDTARPVERIERAWSQFISLLRGALQESKGRKTVISVPENASDDELLAFACRTFLPSAEGQINQHLATLRRSAMDQPDRLIESDARTFEDILDYLWFRIQTSGPLRSTQQGPA